MKRTIARISPSAMDRLQRTLLLAQNQGHTPTACAAGALTSIGIGPSHWPPEPEETVLIVDPKLDGPVYPFMEWSAEAAAERAHQQSAGEQK